MAEYSWDFIKDSVDLRKLITENHGLPIVVVAGEYANTGEFGWEYCSKVYCKVNELLDCDTPFNNDQTFTDRDEFEDRLANYLYDLLENKGITQDEFNRLVDEELKRYEPYWIKVIEIYCDN